MSVTIHKIARDLNLAVSTVSKALRDSYEISEETKRMVLDHARKLGYVPNPYAGSLKSRSTGNIAVVIPEVADTFFSNAINGIDSVAQANGYHVMVYLTHEKKELEQSILRNLRGGRVDGVLISVSADIEQDSPAHAALAKEMPLIFFDRVCNNIESAKVVTDDFEASYKATVHLIEKGCTEIVFLAPVGELSIINERKQGFVKALQDNGIEVTRHHVVVCDMEEHECLKTIKAVLRRKKKADGIIGSIEKLALTAYMACNLQQRKIPDDVRVIAFSNIQIASLIAPPLSTIEQPSFAMGEAAATLLFNALRKKVDIKDQKVVIPSVLRERDSTL